MIKKNLLPVWTIMVLAIVLLHSITFAEEEQADMMQLADSNSFFALDLYDQLKSGERNLFFSPYSISTALAMTFGGARGNTEKQMAQVLHFNLVQKQFHTLFSNLQDHLGTIQEKGNIQLNIANSLWLQKRHKFNESYLALIKKNYGSELYSVNFKKAEAARKLINAWVKECTNEKIEDLIKPGHINAFTLLILANAIYFKGNWANQFDTATTHEALFFISLQDSVTVSMMYQKEKFKYAEDSLLQILEMPYEGDDISMLVLLPRDKNGLPDIERNLHVETLNKWVGSLINQKIRVYLPKLTMTSEFKLGKILASMGMPDAFTTKADFSGITSKKSVFISEVVHKAFVEINEEGTEAAAATAVFMEYSAEKEPVFYANHPFIFLIRDNKTGTILFMGRVVNPLR